MPGRTWVSFSSSLRALGAERSGSLELGLVLATALLITWAWWMASAEVVLVEVSDQAHVEAAAAAVPVSTLVEGRVTKVHLGLGRRVVAGELLVTLETGRLQLEREGHVIEIAGLRAQLAASEREHAAITMAIDAHEHGGRARTSEVRASAREAEVEATLAANHAARSSSLARAGIESAESEEQSRGHQLSRQANVAARRLQVSRTTAELRERVAMLAVDLAHLERMQSLLRGQIEEREVMLASLDHELTEYQVRAPIAGVLGHAPPLRPGAVLGENSIVAQIVPDGALRIVAAFQPSASGRLFPGQPVHLRLDGFPWAEYGSLRGAIVGVASEIVGGSLRVECSIDPMSAPAIPLEHGLVGTLEVDVAHLSPAALLTRGAGRSR